MRAYPLRVTVLRLTDLPFTLSDGFLHQAGILTAKVNVPGLSGEILNSTFSLQG